MLEQIKKMLGITGDYHDETLQLFINSTIYYLENTGITKDALQHEQVLGVIYIGVRDLWNCGSGNGKFSPMFLNRAVQLGVIYGVPTKKSV